MLPDLVLALLAPVLVQTTEPADWPAYAGPRNDRSAAAAPGLGLPADGAVTWKVETPGGFSSFVVAGGRAFTLVKRAVAGEEREVCVALDAATGRELWSSAFSAATYDGGGDAGAGENTGGDGPRSTPAVEGGRVFVLDAALVLAALDAETGADVWRQDLRATQGAEPIRWQSAASPLVVDGRVFVVGGGDGRSLLAFDARDGALLWARGDESMTHATPVLATIHGVRQVVFLVQWGLIAVAPETVEELWKQAFDYKVSTAASPVVHGNVVYVSAGYGVGAGAFVVNRDDAGFSSELLWRKRNRLINHWSTPVCKDGFLYGMYSFKDYGDGPLKCVELATGEERWSRDGFGPGNCILVGRDLVALTDAGEVVLVGATPEAYRERARAEVLRGKCWSSPAFAGGALYVRSTREGARIDLVAR